MTPHCCFVNLETIMSHMRRGCVLGILVKHFLPEITISLGLSPGRLIAIRLLLMAWNSSQRMGIVPLGFRTIQVVHIPGFTI